MKRNITALLLLALLPALAAGEPIDRAFRRALAAEEAEADLEGGAVVRAQEYSKRKAFLLSLFVPGLGQRYGGRTLRSRIFLGLEGMIWTSFAVFKFQEHYRTNDFEEWAESFADVPGRGKDEEFYRLLTIYDSVDDYNMGVRIDARTLFPDDRDAQLRYEAEHQYGADRYFKWKNNQRRLEYRLIRNDARDSGQRADFALVAAVLNRAISAVEAAHGTGPGGNVAGRAASHIRFIPPREGEPPLLRVALRSRF